MIKKMFSVMAIAVVAVLLGSSLTGCEDNVKKETQIEQTHQGPVEMVSPGEPIVE